MDTKLRSEIKGAKGSRRKSEYPRAYTKLRPLFNDSTLRPLFLPLDTHLWRLIEIGDVGVAYLLKCAQMQQLTWLVCGCFTLQHRISCDDWHGRLAKRRVGWHEQSLALLNIGHTYSAQVLHLFSPSEKSWAATTYPELAWTLPILFKRHPVHGVISISVRGKTLHLSALKPLLYEHEEQ